VDKRLWHGARVFPNFSASCRTIEIKFREEKRPEEIASLVRKLANKLLCHVVAVFPRLLRKLREVRTEGENCAQLKPKGEIGRK
jgi:hypothetical protein